MGNKKDEAEDGPSNQNLAGLPTAAGEAGPLMI